MKSQKTVFLFVLMLLFMVACKETSPPTETRLTTKGYDFRKAHWGDTVDEVKKNATESLENTIDSSISDSHSLTGETNILGYTAFVEYVVLDSKLFGGMYNIDIENVSKDKYTVIYNAVAKQLAAEYGDPKLAFEEIASWENDTTSIYLGVDHDSEDNPTSISVIYLSQNH